MQIFHLLLRFYPPEHQTIFAPEMLAVLRETACEKRQRGGSAYIRFALKESFGLLRGAAAEWVAKLTNGNYMANQCPPGQAEQESSLPAEVVKARKHVQSIVAHMENAIANHQFEKARFFSYAEQEARERLRSLQQKYKIVE